MSNMLRINLNLSTSVNEGNPLGKTLLNSRRSTDVSSSNLFSLKFIFKIPRKIPFIDERNMEKTHLREFGKSSQEHIARYSTFQRNWNISLDSENQFTNLLRKNDEIYYSILDTGSFEDIYKCYIYIKNLNSKKIPTYSLIGGIYASSQLSAGYSVSFFNSSFIGKTVLSNLELLISNLREVGNFSSTYYKDENGDLIKRRDPNFSFTTL